MEGHVDFIKLYLSGTPSISYEKKGNDSVLLSAARILHIRALWIYSVTPFSEGALLSLDFFCF